MKELGTQIRALRRARGMTQESLAERLHVSAQAVSKWENHLSAPDVSLLPALAAVFDTTIDELFGYDRSEIEGAVMDVCRASWEYRESDRLKSRDILKAGLERFPGNAILLNNYLYTLDYETENDEIIAVAAKLAESVEGDAGSDDVRYDALRFLAGAYARKGEYDFARATLERIPEIYFTKLSAAAETLRGKEKYDAANAQKWVCLELMVDMMRELAAYYADEGETDKAAAEKAKARELIALFAPERDWIASLLKEVE